MPVVCNKKRTFKFHHVAFKQNVFRAMRLPCCPEDVLYSKFLQVSSHWEVTGKTPRRPPDQKIHQQTPVDAEEQHCELFTHH